MRKRIPGTGTMVRESKSVSTGFGYTEGVLKRVFTKSRGNVLYDLN
jgi:hypothetical protein